jgi:hypothetical protein
MKRFERKSLSFYETSDHYSFVVPSYSKLLDVSIITGQIVILYEYDNTNYYTNDKTFTFKVIKESVSLDVVPFNYDFLKVITIKEEQRIETQSTFSGINFNLTPLIEKNFLIFVNEIKSIDENRDDKLNNLLEVE